MLLCLTAACGGDRRALPQLTRSLSARAPGPPELPMTELTFTTQGDFDRFERETLRKLPLAERPKIYEALIAQDRPSLPLEGPLVLQRLVLVYLNAFGAQSLNQEQRRAHQARGRVLLQELTNRYPGTPDTLFAQAYVRATILRVRGHGFRTDHIGDASLGTATARELQTLWKKLLRTSPDYDGPKEMDADWVRQQLEELQVLFAPSEVVHHPRAAEPGTPVPLRAKEARETLWELEHKAPREHASICRNYARVPRPTGTLRPPSTRLEAQVSFSCGITLHDDKMALAGLLWEAPEQGNYCARTEAIACGRAGDRCVSFHEALAAGSNKEAACWVAVRMASLVTELADAHLRGVFRLAVATGTFANTQEIGQELASVERPEETLGDATLLRLMGRLFPTFDRQAQGAWQALQRRHNKGETAIISNHRAAPGDFGLHLITAISQNHRSIRFHLASRKRALPLTGLRDLNVPSDATDQRIAGLVGALLGSPPAVTLSREAFDGMSGRLLRVHGLSGATSDETFDVHVFFDTDGGTWVARAVSVERHRGDRSINALADPQPWLKASFRGLEVAASPVKVETPPVPAPPTKPSPPPMVRGTP